MERSHQVPGRLYILWIQALLSSCEVNARPRIVLACEGTRTTISITSTECFLNVFVTRRGLQSDSSGWEIWCYGHFLVALAIDPLWICFLMPRPYQNVVRKELRESSWKEVLLDVLIASCRTVQHDRPHMWGWRQFVSWRYLELIEHDIIAWLASLLHFLLIQWPCPRTVPVLSSLKTVKVRKGFKRYT
jgi:hypothetical protein